MTKHSNDKRYNRISTSCTECNGSGHHKPQQQSCDDCYGTGRYVKKVHKACKCQGANPKCGKCQGSGTRTFYRGVVACRRCKGSGTMSVPTPCGTCGVQSRNKKRAMVGTLQELWPTV